MAASGEIYFKKEILETLLKGIEAKKEKGVSITFFISDDTNKWGQNISSHVSQTKEQREAKKDKYYTGNGKLFWLKDGVELAGAKAKQNSEPENKSNKEDFDLF